MRFSRTWLHRLGFLLIVFMLLFGAAFTGEPLPPQAPVTSPVRQLAVRVVGSHEAAHLRAPEALFEALRSAGHGRVSSRWALRVDKRMNASGPSSSKLAWRFP